jgi:hypothetical protein
MKKVVALIVFLLAVDCSFAQTNLTKKQMYQDFDQFVEIIENGNVQLPVRKAVTGFDQIKAIKSLRKNIDTVSCNESFYNLLNLSLCFVMDAHSKEGTAFYAGNENLDGIDTVFMRKMASYYASAEYRNIGQNRAFFKNFPISAVYYDDNYYMLGNHNFVNKDRDTLNIHFMKLISYNGQDISKYIEGNCKNGIRWDYKRKKYYCGDYWGFDFPRNGILKGEQDGKIVEFNLADYPQAIFCSRTVANLDSVPEGDNYFTHKKVEFFDKDAILYIYVDKMIQDSSFYAKIKEVGKGKTIKKVVIDVRGNLGGSDNVWNSVLKAIVKDTLPYDIKLAFNDNKMMKEKLKGYAFKYEKIKWLNNKSYGIISANMKIIPDSNSLKYTGKIYVLGDYRTYSAGHSLVNYADQVDQVVSIGCPTGQMVGFGIGPQLFQLKNSKFSFRLACVIDILNVEKPIDAYKDFPEIEVYPTLEEKLLYPDSKFDVRSMEFLYKYDSMFKKVLAL